MIDYERAELEAEHVLQSLRGARRHCALRLVCLVAALEFLVIAVGAAYAL